MISLSVHSQHTWISYGPIIKTSIKLPSIKLFKQTIKTEENVNIKILYLLYSLTFW